MDRMLFQETFSQLHASDGAKQEVLQMTENRKHSRRRLAGAARAVGIAAAAMMVLVVTAGAINVATDGAFLEGFEILWLGDNAIIATNVTGDQVYMVSTDNDDGFVAWEGERLILHADQDIDITDALAENGSYHYEYEMAVSGEDGSRDPEIFTVDVTGDLADWTATQRNGIGLEVTITSRDGVVSQERITTEVTEDSPSASESAARDAGVVK